MVEVTNKGKTRQKRSAKPVYVLYKPELTENGKIAELELTRSPARAMKFLSENPGAKVEEKVFTV